MWKPRVTPAERIAKLAYVSMAAGELDRPAIQRLSSAADQSNRERDVTGVLVYNGRNFFQVLEGPRDPVYALLTRIIRDPRHHGLSVLYEGGNAIRAFPEWGMRMWAPRLGDDTAIAAPAALEPELALLLDGFAQLQ